MAPKQPGNASGYEPVSAHEAYRAVNARLLEHAGLAEGLRILDVGGGDGSLAETILERFPSSEIKLLEPDPGMLADARHRLRNTPVSIVPGRAEAAKALFEPDSFDRILLANCVHLLDDMPQTLLELKALLRGPGRLALNSAFFAGADDPRERHLYMGLMIEARKELRRRGVELPSRARRSTAKDAPGAGAFVELLQKAGLRVVAADASSVSMSPAMVLDIVSAPVFAQGALPGCSAELATSVLRAAARSIMHRYSTSTVSRRWLTLVAAAQ